MPPRTVNFWSQFVDYSFFITKYLEQTQTKNIQNQLIPWVIRLGENLRKISISFDSHFSKHFFWFFTLSNLRNWNSWNLNRTIFWNVYPVREIFCRNSAKNRSHWVVIIKTKTPFGVPLPKNVLKNAIDFRTLGFPPVLLPKI